MSFKYILKDLVKNRNNIWNTPEMTIQSKVTNNKIQKIEDIQEQINNYTSRKIANISINCLSCSHGLVCSIFDKIEKDLMSFKNILKDDKSLIYSALAKTCKEYEEEK